MKHGSAVPDSRAIGDLGQSLPAVPQQSDSHVCRAMDQGEDLNLAVLGIATRYV